MFVSLLLGEQHIFMNFPWKQDAHEVRLRTFQTFAVPPSEKCEVATVAFSTLALVLELLGGIELWIPETQRPLLSLLPVSFPISPAR